MLIIETIEQIKEAVKNARKQGKRIGFVPTMGYLHEGHMSLVRKAKQQNDFVIVSIFVNPTQFGPNEDFSSYPRNIVRDAELSHENGADVIFHPSVNVMYPEQTKTFVDVAEITAPLCGASRPGHFKGVTTVVCKLFNIIQPDKAYFGQKDAQQLATIEQMVRDLNINVEIVPCPIVREADGLALSSRNVYLDEAQRKAALVLSASLFEAKNLIDRGQLNAKLIREFMVDNISAEPLANIDYVEIVNAKTLNSINLIEGDILMALAVRFGKTRLIDNMRIEV